MSPAHYLLLTAYGNGNGPTIAPASGETFGPGVNSSQSNQFFGSRPYINHAKSVFTDWNNGTLDSNGALATLPIGSSAGRTLWDLGSELVAANIKSGSWLIRWSGPDSGVTVTFTGTGIGALTRGVNRATFTFTPSGSSFARLTFTNSTGSTTFPITNLLVCPAAWETLHDAGRISNPDYVDSLPDNIEVYRTMAIMQMWDNPAISVANLRPESADGWNYYEEGGDTVGFTTGQPYTVAAKMAAEIGCDLQVSFPLKGDQTLYDYIAAQLYSVLSAYPTIRVIGEMNNENWNRGTTRAYLQTYADANGLGPAPRAEAYKSMMVWKALRDAGFPRNQVIYAVGLQLYGSFYPGYPDGGWNQMLLNHVDTAGLISLNATTGSLVDRIFTAPYTHINLGAGAIYHSRLLNLDWANLSDATIRGYFATDNTEISGVIDSFLSGVVTVTGRSDIVTGCYEHGHEIYEEFGNYFAYWYWMTNDQVNNKVVWDLSLGYPPATFTDGDEFIHRYAQENTGYVGQFSTTVANDASTWIRAVDVNSARFYTTQAAAIFNYANDADASAAAIPVDKVGMYTTNNRTRWRAFGTRIKEYFESSGGGTMWEDLYAATVGPTKLRYPMQFYDMAGYRIDDAYVSYWGIKKGPYDSDYPRYLVLKELPAT